MTYEESLTYIASLEKRGWRLGLDRMRELLSLIGDPHIGGPEFFHVAGTNGKGSTTKLIQSILSHAGYRTGSFFSPFVYDFRERIQVDGSMISPTEVSSLCDELMGPSEALAKTSLGGPTEFEFKTAMGFLHWKRSKCQYVALEVGLGGRLDATNVVQPLVSVITEIGLDHQQYLGNTLREIALEKAGIIKPGKPVVCSATSEEAMDTIEQFANEVNAPFWKIEREFSVQGLEIQTPKRRLRVEFSFNLPFQLRNIAAAIAAIDFADVKVSDSDIRFGVQNATLPGRMEVLSYSPIVLLDGAHNSQSAAAVSDAIRKRFSTARLILIYSAATGHDPKATVEAFAADEIHASTMNHPRTIDRDTLIAALPPNAQIHDSVQTAIRSALAQASDGDVVLVSGSFYLLAEAKGVLQRI